MDQTPLVDRDIEAGRRLVEALDRAGVPLTAALWFYLPDGAEWRLVLASPRVKERGPREAHAAVQGLLAATPIDLPLHRVSVVEPGDHLITELRIFAGTDGPPFVGGTFLHGTVVGDAFIDAAYLYRAERIIGRSGTLDLTAATPDRPRKVWVARPARVTVEDGFIKRIEVEGIDWPQGQTGTGVNAHLEVVSNPEHRGVETFGDVDRWTIHAGRLRGVEMWRGGCGSRRAGHRRPRVRSPRSFECQATMCPAVSNRKPSTPTGPGAHPAGWPAFSRASICSSSFGSSTGFV